MIGDCNRDDRDRDGKRGQDRALLRVALPLLSLGRIGQRKPRKPSATRVEEYKTLMDDGLRPRETIHSVLRKRESRDEATDGYGEADVA